MLEVVALFLLCRRNARKARLRGRKPTGFVFMTIGLWMGMEFIGIFAGGYIGYQAGYSLEEMIYTLYIPAVIMAALGAVLSVTITNRCKIGNYVPPQPEQGQMSYAQGAQPNAHVPNPAMAVNPASDDTWITNRTELPVTVVGAQMFGPFSADIKPGESKRVAQDMRANVYEQGKSEFNLVYAIGKKERWAVQMVNDQLILQKE